MVMRRAMSVDTLRDALKSGPMAEVYARLRQAKRRLRREPVAGPLLPEDTPLGVEDLRRLVALLPDHARLLYSLGLQYLESGRQEDALKALACLRSAQTLGFESPDRIALHQARIAAKLGDPEGARRGVLSLVPAEMTVEENALREEVASGRVTPLVPIPQTFPELPGGASESGALLVIGDAAACTAGWCPDARYLLADEGVTGLTLPSVAALTRRFDVIFDVIAGPPGMRGPAREAGLTVARWINL